MRIGWKHAGVGLALFLGVATVVYLGGLLPLKASTGHYAITRAFFELGVGRSLWTWSRGTEIPYELEDPALHVLGAGIYETSCRACHGAPGERPTLAEHMLPPAPDFPREPPRFDPRAHYYVVLHGIRMTGMPGWPAQDRGDEVAAVVSFLQILPTLDRGGYDALVWGERPVGSAVEACDRCHARAAPGIPILDGQPFAYLAASLHAYRDGRRASGAMEPVAAALDDAAIERLARHYAERPPPAAVSTDGPARELAEQGVPARRVAACTACHGPGDVEHPDYPRLVGQDRRYLITQLELFQRGVRGGRFSGVMETSLAHGLEPDEIEALATWYRGASR